MSTEPDECPVMSGQRNTQHVWRFDVDDSFMECHCCGERRDYQELVIKMTRRPGPSVPKPL